MSERFIPQEAQSQYNETRFNGELGEYRQEAGSWMRSEINAAKKIDFADLPPIKRGLLGMAKEGSPFKNEGERNSTQVALVNFRDGLLARAQNQAQRYLDIGGINRFLKTEKESPGAIKRKTGGIRDLSNNPERSFLAGKNAHYVNDMETFAGFMSAITKEAKGLLKADEPELAAALDYRSPGYYGGVPQDVKTKQAQAKIELKKLQAEALISWPPRLLAMAESFLGELTSSTRSPAEVERSQRAAKPGELDQKLPDDPFSAGLDRGVFEFAPDTITELRKSLDSLQGPYPKAVLARLDSQATRYALKWTGNSYEEITK